jgi:hypothetical protein
LVDEFRGSPDKVNNPLDEQANALQLGGEPLVLTPKVEADTKKSATDASGSKAGAKAK